jgi:hypothetical protein
MFMKDANALTGDISTSNAMAHKQVQHLHWSTAHTCSAWATFWYLVAFINRIH